MLPLQNFAKMMKGDDQYVPCMTHFPKRQVPVKKSAESRQSTQKIASIGAGANAPPRFAQKAKKRIITSDDIEPEPEVGFTLCQASSFNFLIYFSQK